MNIEINYRDGDEKTWDDLAYIEADTTQFIFCTNDSEDDTIVALDDILEIRITTD